MGRHIYISYILHDESENCMMSFLHMILLILFLLAFLFHSSGLICFLLVSSLFYLYSSSLKYSYFRYFFLLSRTTFTLSYWYYLLFHYLSFVILSFLFLFFKFFYVLRDTTRGPATTAQEDQQLLLIFFLLIQIFFFIIIMTIIIIISILSYYF